MSYYAMAPSRADTIPEPEAPSRVSMAMAPSRANTIPSPVSYPAVGPSAMPYATAAPSPLPSLPQGSVYSAPPANNGHFHGKMFKDTSRSARQLTVGNGYRVSIKSHYKGKIYRLNKATGKYDELIHSGGPFDKRTIDELVVFLRSHSGSTAPVPEGERYIEAWTGYFIGITTHDKYRIHLESYEIDSADVFSVQTFTSETNRDVRNWRSPKMGDPVPLTSDLIDLNSLNLSGGSRRRRSTRRSRRSSRRSRHSRR